MHRRYSALEDAAQEHREAHVSAKVLREYAMQRDSAGEDERRLIADIVISSNIPLAKDFADKFHANHRYLAYEDLFSIAQTNLVHAWDKYDPSRGAFSTFAVTCMRNAFIKHNLTYLRRNPQPGCMISLDTLGRLFVEKELSDAAHKSEIEPEGVYGQLSLLDMPALQDTIHAGLQTLSVQEQEVIAARYPLSETEEPNRHYVGEKMRGLKIKYHLTEARLRQIRAKALVKLREFLKEWSTSQQSSQQQLLL